MSSMSSIPMNVTGGVTSDASLIWWIGFIIFVVILLYIDLFLEQDSHGSALRQAVVWTLVYVALALLFCFLLALQFGVVLAEEFLTGYLIEKSLSVDNLFVMILTFKTFRIRKRQQKRLLVWGIIGAIIMRAGFILTGSWLLHHFWWTMYVFGGILVVAALKIAFANEEDEDKPPAIVCSLKKWLPWDDGISLDGETINAFFLRDPVTGGWLMTPQFVCLIAIEVGDIIFAFDSIPAIFAITDDPFIVFTSNIFAILGLRAMYFVITGILANFHYLQIGLAFILGFVGMKMLLSHVIHIPTWISLVVIMLIIFLVAILGKAKPKPGKRSFIL